VDRLDATTPPLGELIVGGWEPVPATFDYEGRTATASIMGFTIYMIAD
jgi:hypothetical protein